MDLDIARELGATEVTSEQRLTLYIPNKDRDGNVLADHADWVREAQEILTDIGNGATAYPPIRTSASWPRESTISVAWRSE